MLFNFNGKNSTITQARGDAIGIIQIYMLAGFSYGKYCSVPPTEFGGLSAGK